MTTKMTYTEKGHRYYLQVGGGKRFRAKGVSGIAKIAQDSWNIERWAERMVALGVTLDNNIRENIAVHADNKDMMDSLVEQAKSAAKAHEAADRGTQMHHVLQMVLLGQDHRLMTDQQRIDAEILKRTLDAHKLTPVDGYVEQFVCYPTFGVCGRFDAVLEKPDGTRIVTDLKSGENAVKYGHSTCVQLALYRYAPLVAQRITTRTKTNDDGDVYEESTVSQWNSMPENTSDEIGYVIVARPGDTHIGDLYQMDLEHGWAAGQLALNLSNWRKQMDGGRSIARYLPAEIPSAVIDLVDRADSLDALREAWRQAAAEGVLTDEFKLAVQARKTLLEEA